MAHPEWLVKMPIAHRGLHGGLDNEYPENSIAAFRRAAKYGIPFELDVQLAGDGSLVVLHDANLARVTGEDLAVESVTRKTLQELRIGSSDERVPILYDVLEEINGEVPIVLDVRRWRPSFSTDLEHAVSDATRGYSGELAMQSFDPFSVFNLRRMTKGHPIGQISGSLKSAGRISGAIGRSMAANFITKPDYISYELESLPSRYVNFWHHKKKRPNITWTVTRESEEERAEYLADNYFFDSYWPRIYADKKVSTSG
jgi:glycerophosphoryl diester phosphodiesterase